MNLKFKIYRPNDKEIWDAFVARSFNGTFLHYRHYMDYHSGRFDDHSVFMFNGNKLIGLLPAHRINNRLYSHNGLTYGGWVNVKNLPPRQILNVWKSLLVFLKHNGIEDFYLKEIPLFLSAYLSERNRLAFSAFGRVHHRFWHWIIDTRKPLNKLTNMDRRQNIGKANRFIVRETDQWERFWQILQHNLLRRHQARPVHSLEEILLLKSRFPGNIKLFGAYDQDEMVAGSVLYLHRDTAHFQYVSTLPDTKDRSAVDKLVWEIIRKFHPSTRIISMGTAENEGQIDEKLAYWKYSFGAEIFAQFLWYFDVKSLNEEDV